MDLSSLVFVAIIGVWAAYLVPYWLSRRDDLSQSRTPDRFSGGLRVLQRRSRKTRMDRSGHRSGDAVLTSPRVVVDADGEYLYIPADRALAARAAREAELAAAAEVAVAVAAEVAILEPAIDSLFPGTTGAERVVESAVERTGAELITTGRVDVEPTDAGRVDTESAPAESAPESIMPKAPATGSMVAEPTVVRHKPAGTTSAQPPARTTPAQAAARVAAAQPAPRVVAEPARGRTAAARTAVDPAPTAPRRPAATDTAPVAGRQSSPIDVALNRHRAEIAATSHRSALRRSAFVTGGSPVPAASPLSSGPRLPEAEMSERPFDLEVAIGAARLAARRRAVIMALLFVVTTGSWLAVAASPLPAWAAAPITTLLVLHMLASRVAGLRSRETLMLLAVQVHAAELAQSRPQRQPVARTSPAEAPPEEALTHPSQRVARRAAAVGAETWDPIPVPPPTYTLKPTAHRPEPAPLERPAAAAGGAPAAAAAVSRGALPRRAADVERILALESHLDELFEEPKVVNG